MIFRPRRLVSVGVLLVIAVLLLVGGGDRGYFSIFIFVFCALFPILLYQKLGRAVDSNSQLTDRKTVEFSPSRLLVIGPDWRSEMPWTKFRGFSEDADYFYLHLSEDGHASVIPKSAFTSEQQEKFRQYAKSQTA